MKNVKANITATPTTSVMMDLTRNRYAMAMNEKRVELVSFRCGQNLMEKIENHCRDYKGLSQSMLVSDLVALGLSVFNDMQLEPVGE